MCIDEPWKLEDLPEPHRSEMTDAGYEVLVSNMRLVGHAG